MTPILSDLKRLAATNPLEPRAFFANRDAGRRARKKEMAGSRHNPLKRLETDKEIQSKPFSLAGLAEFDPALLRFGYIRIGSAGRAVTARRRTRPGGSGGPARRARR